MADQANLRDALTISFSCSTNNFSEISILCDFIPICFLLANKFSTFYRFIEGLTMFLGKEYNNLFRFQCHS